MNEFVSLLKQLRKAMLFFLSICFLGWAIVPRWQPYFMGLILGGSVSWINARYLAWKMDRLAEAALERQRRRVNLGFLTRASMALLATVVAVKSEKIALSATLVGLFTAQMATLLLGIASVWKSRPKD